jgi:hypothetical protein
VQRQVREYSSVGLFSYKMNNWQIVVVSLATQRVRNNICLARMIVNVTPGFKAKTRCSSYVCLGTICHTYDQNYSISE